MKNGKKKIVKFNNCCSNIASMIDYKSGYFFVCSNCFSSFPDVPENRRCPKCNMYILSK